MLLHDIPYNMLTENYGVETYQVGDLYLPSKKNPAVICLIHGGYWRMPYNRKEISSIAEKLVSLGLTVWNVEYRRFGAEKGDWTFPFNDVIMAINHLEKFVERGIDLDLDYIIIAGHSAGGHLALWSAAKKNNDAVAIDKTYEYFNAAKKSGDNIQFIELDNTGHMDFLDSNSKASETFFNVIENLLQTL